MSSVQQGHRAPLRMVIRRRAGGPINQEASNKMLRKPSPLVRVAATAPLRRLLPEA